MQNMTLVTPPTASAIDRETIKQHLRIDFPDDDFLLDQLLDAATKRFDGWSGILGRALMPQTWRLTLDVFPSGCITLPLGPVTSVVAVRYWDAVGVQVTMPATDYEVEPGRFEAAIRPVDGWPETDDRLGAVTIEWVAGNGCPAPVRTAIMMLVAHLYENPIGGDALPPAVDALVAPYRRSMV